MSQKPLGDRREHETAMWAAANLTVARVLQARMTGASPDWKTIQAIADSAMDEPQSIRPQDSRAFITHQYVRVMSDVHNQTKINTCTAAIKELNEPSAPISRQRLTVNNTILIENQIVDLYRSCKEAQAEASTGEKAIQKADAEEIAEAKARATDEAKHELLLRSLLTLRQLDKKSDTDSAHVAEFLNNVQKRSGFRGADTNTKWLLALRVEFIKSLALPECVSQADKRERAILRCAANGTRQDCIKSSPAPLTRLVKSAWESISLCARIHAMQDSPTSGDLLRARRAVEAVPGDAYLLANLAVVQLKLKQTTAAIESLQTATRINPGDPELRLLLGYAFMAGGRHSEAEDQRTYGKFLDPQRWDRMQGLLEVFLQSPPGTIFAP